MVHKRNVEGGFQVMMCCPVAPIRCGAMRKLFMPPHSPQCTAAHSIHRPPGPGSSPAMYEGRPCCICIFNMHNTHRVAVRPMRQAMGCGTRA